MQNQDCFEFNEIFLKDFAEAYVDGRFSIFIHNSAKELEDNSKNKEIKMLDVWYWMKLLNSRHKNPFFDSEISEKKKKLLIDFHSYCITTWSDFHRADICHN